MKIAIDYDNTYDLDPQLWDLFIAAAKSRGHKVWIVTCRRDTEENREVVKVHGCRVIFTNLAAKRWAMEQRGVNVDVWIEDDPECIENGK